MKTRQNLKEELLEKYRQRQPTPFVQLDADACDDGCSIGSTWELMNGADVRILIRAGVTWGKVKRLIKIIFDFVDECAEIENGSFDKRSRYLQSLDTEYRDETGPEAEIRVRREIGASIMKAVDAKKIDDVRRLGQALLGVSE